MRLGVSLAIDADTAVAGESYVAGLGLARNRGEGRRHAPCTLRRA